MFSTCGGTPNERLVWSDSEKGLVCPSGKYQLQIELTSLDPIELDRLAKQRARRPERAIAGVGESFEEARADLRKKLPRNAILSDAISFFCEEKDFWESKGYKSVCDNKVYLNKHVCCSRSRLTTQR